MPNDGLERDQENIFSLNQVKLKLQFAHAEDYVLVLMLLFVKLLLVSKDTELMNSMEFNLDTEAFIPMTGCHLQLTR